jgi:hypothetical protein
MSVNPTVKPRLTRWRWSSLVRGIVILVTFGIVAGATASNAGAIDPQPEPEPGEPPEVVRPPYQAPADGFTWRVAGRFGSKIVDPDEPDTPALINYHYCAPERPSVNCFGSVLNNKYKYDDAWVHPQALKTTFDGCPTADERDANQTDYRYKWELLDNSTGDVTATVGPLTKCKLTHDIAINPDTGQPFVDTGMRLTITDPNAATPSAPILGSPFTQTVNPRDYLIVSIGDSYASGEGNPDVPQKVATGPLGIPLPWVERGPRWEDKRCHRSATAGPAQAALRLEGSDPHSSVTFLSFACSGATIKVAWYSDAPPWDPYAVGTKTAGAGILTPYAGAESPLPDDPYFPKLRPQIDQVEDAVGNRRIDALVMSGGGNDIGFGPIATVCVVENNCMLRPVTASKKAQDAGWDITTLDARVHDDLEALAGIYDDLDERLETSTLDIGKVLVTEYPDSTRGLFGLPCPAILDDVIPFTTSLIVATLASILGIAFPWVGAALIANWVATGISPPFTVDLFETIWAGDTVLPSGGSNADHGLDRVIAEAVQRNASDEVPWEMVGGITEDFQGTGALSGGQGHGYCAPDAWIRNATEATWMQGPLDPLSLVVQNRTLGTLHPTADGHNVYATHIFEHLADLLPVPPPVGGSGGAPELFASDTNSVDNSTTAPQGTATVTSRQGTNGWLTGCEPVGADCPSSSALAVEQIVARVNSGTTVRGAGLSINGTAVDCDTGQGLPSGVTCEQELLAGGQLYKWSLQFAADGIYQLHATVNGQDDTLNSSDREVKVDLHDPLTPQASADSGNTPSSGWHRSAVTVTFDIADPGDGGSPLQGVGLQGIEYELDGSAPVMVSAQSQIPPGAPIELAQATITGDGVHTLVYRSVDVGGRTSADVTMQIKIDQTAPTVDLVKPAATTYTLNQSVSASYSCADALSGLVSCNGTTGSGQPMDTSTTGAKTFTVHATDVAGNAADKTVTYQVGYAVRALYDQSKAHKAGSTIPIKLQLTDANGVNQSSPTIVLHRTGLVKVDNSASSNVDPSTASTADADFRYDPDNSGYIFNLKTTGLTTGTWRLDFTTSADGVTHSVLFDIR